MDFMFNLMKPPVKTVRGKIMKALGSGKPEKGSYHIDSFTPSSDSNATDSKASLHWGPEGGFLGFFQWQGRHIEVEDKDANKDLQVQIKKDDKGVSQVAITNGEGEESTELHFPLTNTDESFEQITALKGQKFSEIDVSYWERGEKAEVEFELDDKEFSFQIAKSSE